jgi:two-component system, sensor histidine kinase LadS
VRIKSNGPIHIPLTLWSYDSFVSYMGRAHLLFGAYYSLMAILTLASLYAYFLIKEHVFLRYSVYLLSFLLFQSSINGFSFQFIWGDFPEVTNELNASLVGIVIMAALWFSGEFLQVKDNSQRTYRLFRGLYWFSGVCVLFVWTPLFVIATKILVLCGLVLVLVFAVAATQALLRGYRPARYFTFAWAIFMAGVFVAGLLFAGLVPANFYTIYAIQITSMMEVVILTLALVDRYKVLHEAKASAEMQASSAMFKLNTRLENMVLERTQALNESNKKLQELASKDSLTGLLNHKTAIQEVKKALASVSRYNHTIAVVMLDVDHFKDFNDRYGHQVGDDILIAIADILHGNLRSTDACGRYGGEEFILILTRTELNEVKALGERIRGAISNASFERAPGAKITASLGVVMCYPTQCKYYSADTLITAADNALYEAKNKGRNAVCFAPQLHTVST